MTPQHHRTPWWRRRGTVAAGTAAAAVLLLGAPAVTLTAALSDTEPATTPVRTVTRVPDACLSALDDVDRALERAIMFGQSMVDMSESDGGMHSFAVEGSHHQDSLRFTQHMTGVADQFRTDKTTCRAEGGTP